MVAEEKVDQEHVNGLVKTRPSLDLEGKDAALIFSILRTWVENSNRRLGILNGYNQKDRKLSSEVKRVEEWISRWDELLKPTP